MKNRPPILVILFCLIFLSCHRSDKNIVEAEFTVNKSLLSDSSFISKTGFSVYPPKDWLKAESYNTELQNKIQSRLENKLLAIYKHDSTNCTLIISELPEANYKLIKQFSEKHNLNLEGDSVWTNVQSSVFRYKTYEVIQIVSQNTEMINFKLYTHRLSELYELDYVIPRNEIPTKVKSIESSIGSLN
jgi:hypothetical protein